MSYLHKIIRIRWAWLLAALIFTLINTTAVRADPPADDSPTALQQQLDELKQKVTQTTSDKELAELGDQNQSILTRANDLQSKLQDALVPVATQLNVLGPKPAAGVQETDEVVARRKALTSQKNLLDKQTEQVTAVQSSAQQLALQITSIRRNTLREQLSLNTNSILSEAFWQPILHRSPYDDRRIKRFSQQVSEAVNEAFSPPYVTVSVICLLLALALPLFRKWLEDPITRATVRWVPEGRLIRSFYTLVLVLANVLLLGTASGLFIFTFLRLPDLADSLRQFLLDWFRLCLFTAFLLGLGRALISKRKPSWRLARFSDGVAAAMNPFPRIVAGIMFLFGSLEIINATIGTSVATSVAASGMTALSLMICALVIIARVNAARTKESVQGDDNHHSPLHGVVYLLIVVFAVLELGALLTGYISLARYLAYKMIWVCLVLTSAFFLVRFWGDMCDTIFMPENRVGKLFQRFLKLQERHLSIMGTLLSGVGRLSIIFVALISLFEGSFGNTSPADLLRRALGLWSGEELGRLNIVPANLLNSLLVLIISIYCLRHLRRWLVEILLPLTKMDGGMQASLITLMTNIGYVVIIMATLATLGVKWSNLAWIVSALSVGIGFGLQEIVKNFISGLILLTERPVRVGDLVSISGIEGDIKKISVRATEIQLSDRSTVIVPNSQFISQNVRNVTMGNSLGVVSITLTYPLNIDPVMIRELLLDIYHANESLLDSPQPSVTFTQLGSDGYTLSVTGYVPSPRMIGGTKSELLFEILHQLREKDIHISVPQTVLLQPAEDFELIKTPDSPVDAKPSPERGRE
ncbi:mechanosensitive ion channel protein [Salmonella enterica subsp. enterica serovar Choleraesuis]|nr:mechanosensitive ion channel protein [Salmonella enterica subsp. enterica serovar Choleraesuis]